MEKKYFENEIYEWLNKVNHNNLSQSNHLINVAFHHLLRWYPQLSINGFDVYKLSFIEKLSNWRITNRAIEAFWLEVKNLPANTKKTRLTEIFNQFTHPEHNVPVQVMKLKLIELDDFSIEKVRLTLTTDYEVILISKEEENVLNGAINKSYLLDNNEISGAGLRKKGEAAQRLQAVNAIIDEQKKIDLINWMKNHFLNLN